jgi:hypothetical protein
MTSLESDGFLSEEAEKGHKQIIEVYKDAFELGRQLNQDAMKALQAMHVDWNDKRGVIVAALCIRIVETYQAILLLLQMGMVAQARMLVRTGLDALFSMAAIVKDPELAQSYVAQHYASTIQALKAAKRWKQETLRERLSTEKIDKLISQNEAEMKATKAKKFKVWQWAEKAGLSDFYNVFYVENSSAVHSGMWALNDHVGGVPAEESKIYFGPTDVGLYHTLRSAATMLLTSIETIGKANNLPLGNRIQELRNLWKRLDDTFYRE